MTTPVKVRSLKESDLPEAQRIIRLAFGTFVGAADPENFHSDVDYAGTRWRADTSAAFGAEIDGELVGSNFASRWGSVGFFGPLTVRPDLWDRGVGQHLMRPIMECFERWNVTHAGLFTFAHSPKHGALYQKFGFWPRFLTAVLSKAVQGARRTEQWSTYSGVTDSDREELLRSCSRLTNSLYPGLNLEREIQSVWTQSLGDTVLLRDDREVLGLAVCHCGNGTEAGENKCYIKFGAVQPGPTSPVLFDRLLDACEDFAATRKMSQLEAGVSLARHEAYRRMLDRGFRPGMQGVAMHRPNEPGYSRPGVYVIDDWR